MGWVSLPDPLPPPANAPLSLIFFLLPLPPHSLPSHQPYLHLYVCDSISISLSLCTLFPITSQLFHKIVNQINREYHDDLEREYKTPKIRNNYKGGAVRILTPGTLPSVNTASAKSTKPSSRLPPPIKQGWGNKEGHVFRSWKRRWFVLMEGEMSYYEKPLPNPPYGDSRKGGMSLVGAVVDIGAPRSASEDKSDRKSVSSSSASAAGFNAKKIFINAPDYVCANQYILIYIVQ
jgi:hypothetical protein